MKRQLAIVLAFVFALGTVAALGTAPAPTSAHASPLDAASATDVTATFADQNLYNVLVEQLTKQGITHTADAGTKTVTISAAEAAKITELNLGYNQVSKLTGIGALAALPNLTRL